MKKKFKQVFKYAGVAAISAGATLALANYMTDGIVFDAISEGFGRVTNKITNGRSVKDTIENVSESVTDSTADVAETIKNVMAEAAESM